MNSFTDSCIIGFDCFLVDRSLRSKFYFIFEFCDHDLAGILRNANVKFSLGHIKSIMQQLLDGNFHTQSKYNVKLYL